MIRRKSAGVDNVSVLTDCLFQAYFLFGKCRVLHIKLKST